MSLSESKISSASSERTCARMFRGGSKIQTTSRACLNPGSTRPVSPRRGGELSADHSRGERTEWPTRRAKKKTAWA